MKRSHSGPAEKLAAGGQQQSSLIPRHPHVQLAGVEPHSPGWRGTVMMIHGIDGHEETTWQCEGSTGQWYERLADDVVGLSVISLVMDYRTVRWNRGLEKRIEEYSPQIIDFIIANRLLNRPCFFITHSLGGILFKQLFADFPHLDRNRYLRGHRLNLAGVVFLSVPHEGSSWAAHPLRYLRGRPSIATDDLVPHSRLIDHLHTRFQEGVQAHPLSILDILESLPPKLGEVAPRLKAIEPFVESLFTFPLVVSPPSAAAAMPNSVAMRVPATHFSVASFAYEGCDEAYAAVLTMILDEIPPPLDEDEGPIPLSPSSDYADW
jgi:hypothetical protein